MVMDIGDPAVLDQAITRVRAGDREAYRLVVEACEASVRMVVAAILPDQDRVEDIVQDAFVTAYSKLSDYRPGGNLLSWLNTIARYLALNERRRYCREQHRLGQRHAHTLEVIGDDLATVAEHAPEGLLKILRQCVERLGQTAGEVVSDFYWSGSSTEAIAARKGKNVNWVRVVLHRARSTLANCIERGGGHDQ